MYSYTLNTGAVLAKRLCSDKKIIDNGKFEYIDDTLPVYKITYMGPLTKFKNLAIGDKIIIDTLPTMIDADKSDIHFLILEKNIVGKII